MLLFDSILSTRSFLANLQVGLHFAHCLLHMPWIDMQRLIQSNKTFKKIVVSSEMRNWNCV